MSELTAEANTRTSDQTRISALEARAAVDVYFSGGMIELNLSTGLVANLGTTGYPTAIYIGRCEKTQTTTATTGQRIALDVSGVTYKNVTVTGATGDVNVGDKVYSTTDNPADGTLSFTEAGTPVGTVSAHRSSTSVDVKSYSLATQLAGGIGSGIGGGLLYRSIAASSAHTNTLTEALFDTTYTFPANSIKVGDVIKIRYQGIATAGSSSDTLTIKLYIDGLSGTALITDSAVDVTPSDIFTGEAVVTIRTIGASGTFVSTGTFNGLAAAGAALKTAFVGSTALDTTATVQIGVGADWNVAHTGNSARLDYLTVELIRG